MVSFQYENPFALRDYLEGCHAVQAQQGHRHCQQDCSKVPYIPHGLHQRNTSHLPVVAQGDGCQQKPCIEGQEVGIGKEPMKRTVVKYNFPRFANTCLPQFQEIACLFCHCLWQRKTGKDIKLSMKLIIWELVSQLLATVLGADFNRKQTRHSSHGRYLNLSHK